MNNDNRHRPFILFPLVGSSDVTGPPKTTRGGPGYFEARGPGWPPSDVLGTRRINEKRTPVSGSRSRGHRKLRRLAQKSISLSFKRRTPGREKHPGSIDLIVSRSSSRHLVRTLDEFSADQRLITVKYSAGPPPEVGTPSVFPTEVKMGGAWLGKLKRERDLAMRRVRDEKSPAVIMLSLPFRVEAWVVPFVVISVA